MQSGTISAEPDVGFSCGWFNCTPNLIPSHKKMI